MERHTTILVTTTAAAAAAATLFFFLTYLNHKPASSSNPLHPCIRKISSPKHHTVKGRRRKRVRFAGVKEMKSEKVRRKSGGEKKERGEKLPENWRRLYTGINRYRSQQATLLIYA